MSCRGWEPGATTRRHVFGACVAAGVAGLAAAGPTRGWDGGDDVAAVVHAWRTDQARVESLVALSDVVVVAHVLYVEAHADGPGGEPGIHSSVVGDVRHVLKGFPSQRITFHVHGGQLGEYRRQIVGFASFGVGEDVLLFLRARENRYWLTSPRAGKLVLEAGVVGRSHVVDGPLLSARMPLTQMESLVVGVPHAR